MGFYCVVSFNLPPNTLIMINLGRCRDILHLLAQRTLQKLSRAQKCDGAPIWYWREVFLNTKRIRSWKPIWLLSKSVFETLMPFSLGRKSDAPFWIFRMKGSVLLLFFCAILRSESHSSDNTQQNGHQYDARHSIVFVTKRPGGYDVLLEVINH